MSGLTAEIVLLDRDRRRAQGHVDDLRDAASLGFLPMALSTSAGGKVQCPLATVVIAGS
jgi:malate/lactate dehydrogenase